MAQFNVLSFASLTNVFCRNYKAANATTVELVSLAVEKTHLITRLLDFSSRELCCP
jgi:hypothetical protein